MAGGTFTPRAAGRNTKRESRSVTLTVTQTDDGIVVRDEHGRPPAIETGPASEDDIDRGLWEIALAGGNITRALQSLESQGFKGYHRRTLSSWKNGKYRNRYHELLQGRAKAIEERLAQSSMELALEQHEVESAATQQVMARIGSADAGEAAMALRNLSGAKAANIDKAAFLRGRHPDQERAKSLRELARALGRLGVVPDEPVTDATVVDD
jgi:hypothetical protein